jgi:uncharacterized membrane protein
MNELSIRAALGSAWSHFEKRPWYLFGLTAAAIGLSAFAAGEAVAAALSYIIFGGYLALLLRHARNEHVVFDDLFDIDRRWIYFAFGSVIKTVLILLGLLLFIVPGVYLAVRWMFSELYIIDKGMRPLEALKASSELTAGYRGKLFLYVLLAIVITLLSALLAIIGVFAAIALLNLTTIMLFWKLQELQYKKSIGEIET